MFSQIRTDAINPGTIHDRLKTLKDRPEYDKIMENFFSTMIQVHKMTDEIYHTELAKIYLRKVLKGKVSDYDEFRRFIKDPNSK